jgi:hypothetical protein
VTKFNGDQNGFSHHLMAAPESILFTINEECRMATEIFFVVIPYTPLFNGNQRISIAIQHPHHWMVTEILRSPKMESGG